MASSEHSPDDNLEAEVAESSAAETPFNYKGLPHLFNFSEQQDYHQQPAGPDYGYWACDDTVCKNRWTGPYAKGTRWGIPVNNWQETNIYSEFTSSSFLRVLYLNRNILHLSQNMGLLLCPVIHLSSGSTLIQLGRLFLHCRLNFEWDHWDRTGLGDHLWHGFTSKLERTASIIATRECTIAAYHGLVACSNSSCTPRTSIVEARPHC